MRRNHKVKTLPEPILWTPHKARKTLSLLIRVLDDIRSCALDQTATRLRLNRLTSHSGKLGRAALLGQKSLEEKLESSHNFGIQLFEEALHIGLHPVGPVQGIAAPPCMTSNGLGFLVIDRFAENPLAGWRLADDPPGILRNLPDKDSMIPFIGLPSPTASGMQDKDNSTPSNPSEAACQAASDAMNSRAIEFLTISRSVSENS